MDGRQKETITARVLDLLLAHRLKILWFLKLKAVVLVFGSIAVLVAHSLSLGFNGERSDNEIQFKYFADRVVEKFRDDLQQRLLALDAFSVAATSFALSTNQSWPTVSIPDFAQRAGTTRQQIGALTLGLLPIVSQNDRQKWEEFSVEHQGWIAQGRAFDSIDHEQDQTKTDASPAQGISTTIFTTSTTQNNIPIKDEGTGPFVVVWQTSPAPQGPGRTNYNLLSHPVFWKAIERVIDSKRALMSEVLNLDSPHTGMDSTVHGMAMTDPISAIYYPVFRNFGKDEDIVAMLGVEVAWNRFFENVLPSNARGIICVVHNQCHQTFSWRIDGDKVAYLGSGDFHDHQYDDMVEQRSVVYFGAFSDNFAAAGIDYAQCPFTLHVYPSSDTFVGSQAYLSTFRAAIAVTVAFMFAIAVFVLERLSHQQNSGSNRTVLDLDKQFPVASGEGSLKKAVLRAMEKRLPRLHKFVQDRHQVLATHKTPRQQQSSEHEDVLTHSSDTFVNATVLCAGVCGIKAWQKVHAPGDKVLLLETIQSIMLDVAQWHNIDQIELDGDCIMAITGMADCDDDHAVIMARFVSDCFLRLEQQLQSKPEYNGLAMQYGVSSGQVAATAYYGESARFDLFGDTIEVCQDMLRSTMAMRIHASVETAELLSLAGKGGWTVPRNERILTRRKGEMSTFWIDPDVCGLDTEKFKATDSIAERSGIDVSYGQIEGPHISRV